MLTWTKLCYSGLKAKFASNTGGVNIYFFSSLILVLYTDGGEGKFVLNADGIEFLFLVRLSNILFIRTKG